MTDNVVQLKSGAVRGLTNSEGIVAFKGIPYAAPPFGPNRFQPPQPVVAWDGVRDATDYGATAPKPPYFPPFDAILPEPSVPGQDCLNLNVWTPSLEQNKLPVMVWIHGGAFANGSNAIPSYDGSRFARDGVICVGINYRLGVDGFLYLGDDIVNLGLLDQIAALRWVQENIESFGGDPTNVTIFGESAGGMSVTTLLSLPQTEGLFRRVIAQSGAGHHVISPQTAQRIGGYLAEKLGVEPDRAAIAGVAVEQVLQAQVELSGEAFANPDPNRWGEVAANLMPFEPVVDGQIVPSRPIDAIIAGAGAKVDVMMGYNTEEERLFFVPNGAIDYFNDDMLHGAIAAYGLPVEETLATYRASRPDATAGELLSTVVSDWFFRVPAIRVAEAHSQANQAGTYMYEFAWWSPQFNNRLGPCHSLEIPFVFDTLDKGDLPNLLGPNPPQATADAMHAAWVAFAKTGNPGWPQFDAAQRATMRFDTDSELVHDPNSAERQLWDGKR